MRFKKIAAFVLVIVMCVCSIGAFATTEEEYQARISELEAQVADLEHQLAAKEYVAEFDGGYVTVDEAMEKYDYVSYMYSSYGYSMSGYENNIKTDIMNTLLEDKLVRYMGEQLGLDQFDEEKEATFREEANAILDDYVEVYKDQFATEGLTDDEIRAQTLTFLAQNDINEETLTAQQRNLGISQAVFAHVADRVTITDDDVKTRFDELVKADQVAYSAGSSAFEYAVSNGTAIYWNPVGYRRVKQVLVAFDDDQNTRYAEITGKISDLEKELESIETAEEPRAEEEIQADLDSANADLTALYEEIIPTADKVVSKFGAGEDIDSLIAEFGGDPGSINDDGTINTYVVSENSTSYDEPFKQAAMSLTAPGQLSDPAKGRYGLYIVYYDSDIPSGEVDYDSIFEELHALTLDEKRTEAYDAQLAAWKDELHVVYYIENFR